MAVLVTGGAGYIGSHTVRLFQEKREDVVVADNLQSGHPESLQGVPLYRVDIRDGEGLAKVFKRFDIEAVLHFSASSLVGESVDEPFNYYHNNVYGMLTLLGAMRKYRVDKMVFSSTAAVYGEPGNIPIQEGDETLPTNPYGETKLAMEKMMKWFEQAYGIKYVSLRYFNAAGAHESGEMGEDHHPETHLIPLILQVPLGQRDRARVFGDDYPTRDGTCIRDYIHVMDLAEAHLGALNYLRQGRESDIFNLGNGTGYSVAEVMETARQVTGHPLPADVGERRAGDPAVLVASSTKAGEVLGWRPRHPALERIILDAWNWHRKNPRGYQGR